LASDSDSGGVCPVCGFVPTSIFFQLPGIPASDGALWPSREQAYAAPTSDFRLAFCPGCGYIGNEAFDLEKVAYAPGYNSSLHYSPVYQNFIDRLVQELVVNYGIRDKTVCEIGCGNGDFLLSLCRLGHNTGFGVDPTVQPHTIELEEGSTVTFVQDLYGERYAHCQADLICARHVLSDGPDPEELVQLVRRACAARPDTLIYFEVPNAQLILQDLAVWNLMHEHRSYFTEDSLVRLVQRGGFTVRTVGPRFSGQYLGIIAGASDTPVGTVLPSSQALNDLAMDVAAFSQRFGETVATWRSTIADIERSGRRAVAWGAGGRAITLLNVLHVGNLIPYVVDVNPMKQGTFLPVTGQQIVAPSFLVDYQPDLIVITNAAFEGEIREQVREFGLSCEFLVA